MNFQKISEGRGVISDLKNSLGIFFALEIALLVMNFRENFEIFVANLVLVQPVCHEFLKKIATYFPKKGPGGGGVKAVRKFSENSSILAKRGFPKPQSFFP